MAQKPALLDTMSQNCQLFHSV